MKPHLLKVPLRPEFSFSIRYDIVPYFYNHWHYHPEVELIHIHKGTGTQFLGDSIEHFEEDDMLLIGSDLAHMWRCDEQYFNKAPQVNAEATVIHFLPKILGDFILLPENEGLLAVLENAKQGMFIYGETRLQISGIMQQMLSSKGAQRLIYLLMILNLIADSTETKLLSSKNFLINKLETNKLDIIYQYVLNNFKNKISLNEVAALANFSPKAFCRYFKSRTRKTFSGFLMEVRIGYACKLLREQDSSISDVCFESGFNNVSNFNRYFKVVTQKTPLQYKMSSIDKPGYRSSDKLKSQN